LLGAKKGKKDTREESKRQIVQSELNSPTVSSRYEWNSDDFGATVPLPLFPKQSVTWEEPPVRIVWYAGEDCDVVPTIHQTCGQIIDAKVLWPKVLTNNKNIHNIRRNSWSVTDSLTIVGRSYVKTLAGRIRDVMLRRSLMSPLACPHPQSDKPIRGTSGGLYSGARKVSDGPYFGRREKEAE